MIVITDVFREIVERVSKEYGKHISYMFGDWSYISDQLLVWSKSNDTAKLKYPAIFLYSPIEEDRRERENVIGYTPCRKYIAFIYQRRTFAYIIRRMSQTYLRDIDQGDR